MTIILKIENVDQLPDGGPIQYQTSGRSFEIGREQHLDWALPDPNRVISGRHCEVRFEKGGYWLYDVSRNGTFLNNSGSRMKSPHHLEQGDRIQIGHYLISVAVQDAAFQGATQEEQAPAQGGSDSIWDLGGSTPAPVDRRAFMPEQKRGNRAPDFSEQYIDLPDMRPAAAPAPQAPPETPFGLPPHAAEPKPMTPSFVESPFGAVTTPPVQPIPPRPSPTPLPPIGMEGFAPPPGFRAPAGPVVQPAPAPMAPSHPVAPPPAVQGSSSSFLHALAAGAGVPPETFDQRNPDEVAHEIGTVLKVVLEQLAVLLKARAAAKVMTKSSNRTMISADHNNPLKFIPATSEIIDVMFARRRPGYLDAQRSVEEAFSDLKSHEIATFAAMQKALAKLLDGLSPQSIETKLTSSAFSSKKARAWEMFVERWDSKTDPYENGMLDVFLAYFAEAYDEAVRKR